MTILEIAGQALQIIATACAPIIAWKLAALVGLQNDVAARSIVTTAITRGTGLMLQEGVKLGDPLLLKAENKSAAMGVAINYVNEVASKQTAKLGIGEQMVAKKIASQLALTLHAPTVAATVKPAVTLGAVVPPHV